MACRSRLCGRVCAGTAPHRQDHRELPAVEAWRKALPPVEQRRLNHPSLWFKFCRATKPARAVTRPVSSPNQPARGKASHRGGYHRAIHFDQDMVKRAGDAMRQSWSNDVYRLAAIALAAALRNENDLLALLPADRPAKPAPPKPAPRQIAAPAALELA